MAEASLQPIYERLNGADRYHPFSANTFADWSVEAGDIVNLKRGSDSYASPVHTSHMLWRGSQQITMQTRGNKQLDSISKATQKKFAKSGGAYRAARTVAKKSSVYFQKPDPQLGSELNINDVWIESDMLNSWDDIGELTWEELAEYTWMDFYGSKMYAWDGTKWVQISDEQKENYNFDLLRNTTQELLSVKADLSGQYSKFLQKKNEISAEVVDTKNGLSSRITQTAGEIRSEMTDTKNGLSSLISQTASQIRSEVTDSVNGLQSSITQTASQIRSEVSDSVNGLQSSITQNADKISLVVEGTGANAHIKPASIVAAINAQTGQSAVKISADMIVLDGDSVATSLTGKDISANELGCDTIGVGSDLYFDANVTLHSAYGDTHDCENMIVKAEVSGNTLTLTPLTGNAITFSKATTLTPSWSGSALTVTAYQTNSSVSTSVGSKSVGFGGSYGAHDVELEVVANGGASKNTSIANTIDVPVAVNSLNSGQTAPTQRYTKTIPFSVSSLLQTKTASSNGDVTPDSGYIGLSNITVNVNPTLSGSWSGSALTVGTTPGTNKYTVGFGGSYGDHDVDLVVAQNGSVARSNASTAIIPIKVAQLQGGGASTNRYTPNLLVDMSSLLTTGSFNSSGTKTPGSDYIGFSSVSISLPKSALSATKTKHTSEPTDYDNVMANITSNGWFTITASAWGVSRVYKFKVDV